MLGCHEQVTFSAMAAAWTVLSQSLCPTRLQNAGDKFVNREAVDRLCVWLNAGPNFCILILGGLAPAGADCGAHCAGY